MTGVACNPEVEHFSLGGGCVLIVLKNPHISKTPLRQPIVAWPSLPAARALRPAVQARLHLNLKGWNRCAFNPMNSSVDK